MRTFDLAQMLSAFAVLSLINALYNLEEVQEVNYDLNIDAVPFGFENFKLDDSIKTQEDITKIVSTLKVFRFFYFLEYRSHCFQDTKTEFSQL